MIRAIAFIAAFASLLGAASAQTPPAQPDGAAQAVGLFAQTCVQFGGNPSAVRNFLRQRHVPELTPEAKAIFVRDHVGVGFDATNKATRLALVSEDNGVCTVFAETVDATKVNPLLQTIAQRAGAPLVEDGGHEADGFVTHFYKLTRFGRQFAVVISTGGRPDAPFHAALTLAPSK